MIACTTMAMTTQQSLSSTPQDCKTVSSASNWKFMHNVYPVTQCFSVQMSQFCTLQLFRFVDFKNIAVFEPRIYEGIDAERIAQIL